MSMAEADSARYNGLGGVEIMSMILVLRTWRKSR
jgi:hypothetical protein